MIDGRARLARLEVSDGMADRSSYARLIDFMQMREMYGSDLSLVEEEQEGSMSQAEADADEDCVEDHYAELFLNRLVAIVTSNERFLKSVCHCLAMTGCSAGMWKSPLEDEEWRSIMYPHQTTTAHFILADRSACRLSGVSSPYVSWNGQDDSGFFLIQDAYHEVDSFL